MSSVMLTAVASLFKAEVKDGLIVAGVRDYIRFCIDCCHHVWDTQRAGLDLCAASIS